MSRERDEISVEVSSDKVAVSAAGPGASDLLTSLTDLLSPLTQGLGYIGDKIRLHRIQSAVAALQLTRQIAEDKDISLNAVPPKILIPWLEGASLEDDDAESLTSMWASLLVSASTQTSGAEGSYIDLLRKISPQEARFLLNLALDTNPEYSKEYYRLQNNKTFPDYVPQAIESGFDEEELTGQQLLEATEGLAMQSNVVLLYIAHAQSTVWATDFFEENEKSISALEKEGAVVVEIAERHIFRRSFSFCWLELTKFGFDFIWACERGSIENE